SFLRKERSTTVGFAFQAEVLLRACRGAFVCRGRAHDQRARRGLVEGGQPAQRRSRRRDRITPDLESARDATRPKGKARSALHATVKSPGAPSWTAMGDTLHEVEI